ncbi:hypothetical protein BJX99DRAFT_97658 [Aspergillus californicus]
MGAQTSQQVAEAIITACQRPDARGRIDGILLDEQFRTHLSGLLEEVPSSFRKQVCRKPLGNKRKYGEEKTIRHRAFSRLWTSSGPSFDPSLGVELMRCPLSGSSPGSCIASVYLLKERRMIDSIRWRLCLASLSALSDKFEGGCQMDTLIKQVIDIVIASKCPSDEQEKIKEKINKDLPSLLLAAKKYRVLSNKLGIGALCCLPPDIGDSLWEKFFPLSGSVHETCVKLLFDTGIREESLTIISPTDRDPVTVSLAARKVFDFWEKRFNNLNLEYIQPGGFSMTTFLLTFNQLFLSLTKPMTAPYYPRQENPNSPNWGGSGTVLTPQ